MQKLTKAGTEKSLVAVTKYCNNNLNIINVKMNITFPDSMAQVNAYAICLFNVNILRNVIYQFSWGCKNGTEDNRPSLRIKSLSLLTKSFFYFV